MHGASVDETDAYFFHIDFLFPRRPISRIARDFDRSAESARRLPTRPLKGKIEKRHADLHFSAEEARERERIALAGRGTPSQETQEVGQRTNRKQEVKVSKGLLSPPVVLDVASSTSCLWSYFSLLRVVFCCFFPAFLFCENVKCLFLCHLYSPAVTTIN